VSVLHRDAALLRYSKYDGLRLPLNIRARRREFGPKLALSIQDAHLIPPIAVAATPSDWLVRRAYLRISIAGTASLRDGVDRNASIEASMSPSRRPRTSRWRACPSRRRRTGRNSKERSTLFESRSVGFFVSSADEEDGSHRY
jgi:hypothetical protein